MKPFTKKTMIAALLFLSIWGISSCSQEPIFADIEKEIKLKKFTVQNLVYGLVECDGVLYAAHGAISSKSADSQGGWEKISAPAGKPVIKLAVAKNELFALTDNLCVWKKSGGDWVLIPQTVDGVVCAIFGNGDSAYAAVQNSDPAKSGVYSLPDFALQEGGSASCVKCTKDGIFSADFLCWTDPTGKGHADSSQITSLVASAQAAEFWNGDGKNWIVVAAKSGFFQIPLDENYNIAGDAVKNGLANASTTVGIHDAFLGGLWVVGDTIFLATCDKDESKNDGLWAYYPSRGDWNKE